MHSSIEQVNQLLNRNTVNFTKAEAMDASLFCTGCVPRRPGSKIQDCKKKGSWIHLGSGGFGFKDLSFKFANLRSPHPRWIQEASFCNLGSWIQGGPRFKNLRLQKKSFLDLTWIPGARFKYLKIMLNI